MPLPRVAAGGMRRPLMPVAVPRAAVGELRMVVVVRPMAAAEPHMVAAVVAATAVVATSTTKL